METVKPKFYQLREILRKNADYNIIFGERSNGKTYATLAYGISRYVENGQQMAYVRRWREDLRGKRAESLFANHVANGYISELTNNEYTETAYLGGKWYLCRRDENGKRIPDNTPFCYGFCLSEQEHEKSSSYPNITTIVFDEFLTRRYYLPDEFMLFMNTLSTIIRQRDNVKVFMLGNTVNKYCPYFTEMGLRQVPMQAQGTIDIYKFGEHGATVAVEYCASMATQKKSSNKYFCFDNQNLQMITGGKWELAIYPHLPIKYKPNDVLLIYYIQWQDTTLQCNIVQVGDDMFTYIHMKTTPIKDPYAVIYSLTVDSSPYHHRKLLSTATPLETKISSFYATDKVFYQDNEVGEMVRNYIMSSTKNNLIK